MSDLRYRIQHNNGPNDLDHSYRTLPTAKRLLTQRVRELRSYSYCIVDQETDETYEYDEEKKCVVLRKSELESRTSG